MEHRIQVQINARYYTHGNPSAKTLIVALHGYGQLASYFIRKFEFLNPEKYYVIVPEGLHHFYLNGTSGRVGASWMTKEDRENDITNYIHFIDTILKENITDTHYTKKILLGFSQGGATASRYMALGNVSFANFILWAAVFPPDMDQKNFAFFKQSKNYFVVGNNDPYYTEDQIKEHIVALKEADLQFDLIKFDGTHTIDTKPLVAILDEI